MAEECLVDAVFCSRAQCDRLAAERFRYSERAAGERDVAAVLHAPDGVCRRILERRDALLIVARTWPVALDRRRKAERLVRPLAVIDAAPASERRRCRRDIIERAARQHLGLQAPMEALVLAHRLGMIGSRMGDAHALFDQEHTERRIGRAGTVTPWRAVVGDQRFGRP